MMKPDIFSYEDAKFHVYLGVFDLEKGTLTWRTTEKFRQTYPNLKPSSDGRKLLPEEIKDLGTLTFVPNRILRASPAFGMWEVEYTVNE